MGITRPRIVQHDPGGIFVDAGTDDCLYWLHTHANDDIIHTEAPYKHIFTLGQFFAICQQAIGTNRVGLATGKVTAFINGRRYGGNLATCLYCHKR